MNSVTVTLSQKAALHKRSQTLLQINTLGLSSAPSSCIFQVCNSLKDN